MDYQYMKSMGVARPDARAMTGQEACDIVRGVLCSISGEWCERSCGELTDKVCNSGDLFVTEADRPIRDALCGGGGGICLICDGGKLRGTFGEGDCNDAGNPPCNPPNLPDNPSHACRGSESQIGQSCAGAAPTQRYSDDVASELAARYYSAQFNVPISQARQDIQKPENWTWKVNAIGMAQAGQLDSFLRGATGKCYVCDAGKYRETFGTNCDATGNKPCVPGQDVGECRGDNLAGQSCGSAPPPGNTICDQARAQLCAAYGGKTVAASVQSDLSGARLSAQATGAINWCKPEEATCAVITNQVCEKDCTIFKDANNPIRMGLCGTMTCPKTPLPPGSTILLCDGRQVTEATLKVELAAKGYGGPWDVASMQTAYKSMNSSKEGCSTAVPGPPGGDNTMLAALALGATLLFGLATMAEQSKKKVFIAKTG